ncbi:hypothetical protein ACQEVG_37730 [Streptomyces sp. CA-135486]|uniref:hypothetical protein n=1 Tax=Streptomyces sp. CA-135486 TaxID=3240049 RepID=UPI003D91E2FD
MAGLGGDVGGKAASGPCCGAQDADLPDRGRAGRCCTQDGGGGVAADGDLSPAGGVVGEDAATPDTRRAPNSSGGSSPPEHRAAASCLHLHHLALGEMWEAKHWRHQVTNCVIDAETLDENFLTMLKVVARCVRHNGSTASPPPGGLEMEVDRLAEDGNNSCIIVRRPDRLHDFTRR